MIHQMINHFSKQKPVSENKLLSGKSQQSEAGMLKAFNFSDELLHAMQNLPGLNNKSDDDLIESGLSESLLPEDNQSTSLNNEQLIFAVGENEHQLVIKSQPSESKTGQLMHLQSNEIERVGEHVQRNFQTEVLLSKAGIGENYESETGVLHFKSGNRVDLLNGSNSLGITDQDKPLNFLGSNLMKLAQVFENQSGEFPVKSQEAGKNEDRKTQIRVQQVSTQSSDDGLEEQFKKAENTPNSNRDQKTSHLKLLRFQSNSEVEDKPLQKLNIKDQHTGIRLVNEGTAAQNLPKINEDGERIQQSGIRLERMPAQHDIQRKQEVVQQPVRVPQPDQSESAVFKKQILHEAAEGTQVKTDKTEFNGQKSVLAGFDKLNEPEMIQFQKSTTQPLQTASNERAQVSKLQNMIRQELSNGIKTENGWKSHQFSFEDGSSVRLGVKRMEGMIQLQLGSANQDLNRLIQYHASDIREYLEKEMGLDVNLEFQFDENSTPEAKQQNSELRKGLYGSRNESSNLNNEQNEGVKARSFGFNENEWTA